MKTDRTVTKQKWRSVRKKQTNDTDLRTHNDSMGTAAQDFSFSPALFSGISHVKALAAGWRWGFTHRNPTLAEIWAGENVWAEWWHLCMSQMRDRDDWVSTNTLTIHWNCKKCITRQNRMLQWVRWSVWRGVEVIGCLQPLHCQSTVVSTSRMRDLKTVLALYSICFTFSCFECYHPIKWQLTVVFTLITMFEQQGQTPHANRPEDAYHQYVL